MDFSNGPVNSNWLIANYYTYSLLFFEYFTHGSQDYRNHNINLQANQWYHFIYTVDTSGNVEQYMDGVLVPTAPAVDNDSDGVFNIQRTINYIGKSVWSTDAYFKGSIDELVIYNYIFSEN